MMKSLVILASVIALTFSEYLRKEHTYSKPYQGLFFHFVIHCIIISLKNGRLLLILYIKY